MTLDLSLPIPVPSCCKGVAPRVPLAMSNGTTSPTIPDHSRKWKALNGPKSKLSIVCYHECQVLSFFTTYQAWQSTLLLRLEPLKLYEALCKVVHSWASAPAAAKMAMCKSDTALSSRTARKRRNFPRAEDTAKPFLSKEAQVLVTQSFWISKEKCLIHCHVGPQDATRLHFHTFQDRLLHLRIRRVDPAPKFCHLINAHHLHTVATKKSAIPFPTWE